MSIYTTVGGEVSAVRWAKKSAGSPAPYGGYHESTLGRSGRRAFEKIGDRFTLLGRQRFHDRFDVVGHVSKHTSPQLGNPVHVPVVGRLVERVGSDDLQRFLARLADFGKHRLVGLARLFHVLAHLCASGFRQLLYVRSDPVAERGPLFETARRGA